MAKASTAPALTERDAGRKRVLIAAVEYVYGPCANTLMELEEAVTDLIGQPLSSRPGDAARAALEAKP